MKSNLSKHTHTLCVHFKNKKIYIKSVYRHEIKQQRHGKRNWVLLLYAGGYNNIIFGFIRLTNGSDANWELCLSLNRLLRNYEETKNEKKNEILPILITAMGDNLILYTCYGSPSSYLMHLEPQKKEMIMIFIDENGFISIINGHLSC